MNPYLIYTSQHLHGLASVSFGGGYAMLPILQREVVENRRWATEDELMDYAIGQCTPALSPWNTSTFIGYKTHGTSAHCRHGRHDHAIAIIRLSPHLSSSLRISPSCSTPCGHLGIAVCALVLQSVWKWRKALLMPTSVILLVTFGCRLLRRFPPVVMVVIAAAVAGIIIGMIGGSARLLLLFLEFFKTVCLPSVADVATRLPRQISARIRWSTPNDLMDMIAVLSPHLVR